jgi:hypothetical protein
MKRLMPHHAEVDIPESMGGIAAGVILVDVL